MGNITEIFAIDCDECNGAGFLFFGNDEDFDVMQCDCVAGDVDFADGIMGA